MEVHSKKIFNYLAKILLHFAENPCNTCIHDWSYNWTHYSFFSLLLKNTCTYSPCRVFLSYWWFTLSELPTLVPSCYNSYTKKRTWLLIYTNLFCITLLKWRQKLMSSSWYFTYTRKNPLLNDCYRRISLDFGHIDQCQVKRYLPMLFY